MLSNEKPVKLQSNIYVYPSQVAGIQVVQNRDRTVELLVYVAGFDAPVGVEWSYENDFLTQLGLTKIETGTQGDKWGEAELLPLVD